MANAAAGSNSDSRFPDEHSSAPCLFLWNSQPVRQPKFGLTNTRNKGKLQWRKIWSFLDKSNQISQANGMLPRKAGKHTKKVLAFILEVSYTGSLVWGGERLLQHVACCPAKRGSIPSAVVSAHFQRLAAKHVLRTLEKELNMSVRTQKIQLTPNNKQATLLAQHCGKVLFPAKRGKYRYARVAYNAALSSFKSGLDEGHWKTLYDIKKEFNAKKREIFPWCDAMSQNASKNAIHHFSDAVRRWLSGQNKFPKPKNRSGKQSYQAESVFIPAKQG